MRLPRPYIPLKVRVAVAERQGRESFGPDAWSVLTTDAPKPLGERLQWLLKLLFHEPTGWKAGLPTHDVQTPELHHRPALVNRRRRVRDGKTVYDPPANDPEHLVYLAADDHDVETRIRGIGAQRSDLGQARYLKRVKRNREKRAEKPARRAKATRRPVPTAGAPKARQRPPPGRREGGKPKRWPSRAIRGSSRWPKKGTRGFGR